MSASRAGHRGRTQRPTPESTIDTIIKCEGTDDSLTLTVICGSAEEFYNPHSLTRQRLRGLHLADPGCGSSSQVLHVPVESLVSWVHATDCPWELLDTVTGSTIFLAQDPLGDRRQFTICLPYPTDPSGTGKHHFYVGNSWNEGGHNGGIDAAKDQAKLRLTNVAIASLYSSLLKYGKLSDATCTVVHLANTLPSSTPAEEFEENVSYFRSMVEQGLGLVIQLEPSHLSTSKLGTDTAHRVEYVKNHLKFLTAEEFVDTEAATILVQGLEGVQRAR